MEKLFTAYSIVPTFKYKDKLYENVRIDWFVSGRNIPLIPVEAAVIDHDLLSESQRNDAENYLKELFTQEEAQQLGRYLKEKKNINVIAEEVNLPVGKIPGRRRSLALNPGTGFYRPYQKESYNLPFQAEGFYNVNVAEEKIMPDDKKTVITRKPIRETDEE